MKITTRQTLCPLEVPFEQLPQLRSSHQVHFTQPGDLSSNNAYFFYQRNDGSAVFLHSLNYRSLVEEYGNDLPAVISGRVLEVMQVRPITIF